MAKLLRLGTLFALLGVLMGQQMRSMLPKVYTQRTYAQAYKEYNLCPYMGVPDDKLNYYLWTCTIPYVQPYCGRMSTIEYDCCPGFRNTELVKNQCAESESVWRLMLDHLSVYDKFAFQELLAKANIPGIKDNTSTNAYTVFVPYSDTSFGGGPIDYKNDFLAILTNVVKDRIYSMDFKNKKTLESLYNKQKLKITQYSNGLVFVECRAIVNPDHESKNGVIHVLSGPIYPTDGSGMASRKTVFKALFSNQDTRAFSNDIPQDIKTMLDNEDSAKWYTVFAPKNAQWSAIKRKYPGREQLRKLVLNHIITKMICAGAIIRNSRSLGPTLAGEYIGVDCMLDMSRVILDSCNKAQKIIKEDIMAGNGVIHVIDGYLVPTAIMDAKTVYQCLGTGYNLTSTMKYFDGCDLLMKAGKKYILLIPINEAYDWLNSYRPFTSQAKRFRTDAEYRCNTYRFHVMQLIGKYATIPPSWWIQIPFKTNYNPGRDSWETNYYVKFRYGSELYFHYSRVINKTPFEFRDGFIYFIDRINVLPEKTMIQILKSRTDFSIVHEKTVSLKLTDVFVAGQPRFLYIVPRNRGWTGRSELKFSNQNFNQLLRLHIVDLYLWGYDIGYFHRETYTTLKTILQHPVSKDFFKIIVKRNLDGNTFVGYESLPYSKWAMVVEWNLYAFDGIIWVIDWPLVCPPEHCVEKEGPKPPKTATEIDSYALYVSACIRGEDIVETKKQYRNDPITIAQKYPAKCAVYSGEKIKMYTFYNITETN